MILAGLGQLWVPMAWYLLPNKETGTYRAALDFLKQQAVDDPKIVHLDFESAEIRALMDVHACCWVRLPLEAGNYSDHFHISQ